MLSIERRAGERIRDQMLERRNRKIRGAHEDELEAHTGSRDSLAALANFLTTRSRFSREI